MWHIDRGGQLKKESQVCLLCGIASKRRLFEKEGEPGAWPKEGDLSRLYTYASSREIVLSIMEPPYCPSAHYMDYSVIIIAYMYIAIENNFDTCQNTGIAIFF